MTTFKDLGLSGPLLDALTKIGYTDPTPIQEQSIPELLAGHDVIGQAQTGTGKTAAFGLPMMQMVDPEIRDVQALVLTPTRELCIQVAQSLRAYGAVRGIDVLATFGGAPIRQQMDRLKAGPQVVVGTVGRVLDLHSRHSLMFHDARYVVLDEADEMLDLGFLEDVELILKKCPRGRQTALFSATMPTAIARLAENHLFDPVTIKVKSPTLTIDLVDHFKLEVARKDKVDALVDMLSAERPRQAIIFARTKIGVDRLARDLDKRKPALRVRALHGDMSQGSRDGVMISFKDGRVPVLVATDIAARGLDVQNVTHVINYDLPNSAEIYTHRIGRTGRAGHSGRAVTLVEPRERDEMAGIEKFINVEIPDWTPAAVGKSKVSPGDNAAGDKGIEGDERKPRTRRSRGERSAGGKSVSGKPADEKPEDDKHPDEDRSGVASSSSDEVTEVGVTDSGASETTAAESDVTEAGVIEDGQAEDTATEPGADDADQAAERTMDLERAAAELVQAVEDDDGDGDVANPPEREIRRPRHLKPNQEDVNDDGFSLLIVGRGSSAGVEPADVIELITSSASLTGDEIRRVRVLSHFTLARVPSEKAAAAADAIDGSDLRGNAVSAEAVTATR